MSESDARSRRSREGRRILYQRSRTGRTSGPSRGVVETAEAESRRPAAAERGEPHRPGRQDAGLVRPDAPGDSNRFDSAHDAANARHERRAADPRSKPGTSRSFAPRQRPGEDRPTQNTRTGGDEDASRLLYAVKANARGRRGVAQPDDDLLQQQPGRRLEALGEEYARLADRRRLQTRATFGLRRRKQQAAVEPLREHVATHGNRSRQIRQQHGNALRAGDGEVKRYDPCGTGWR